MIGCGCEREEEIKMFVVFIGVRKDVVVISCDGKVERGRRIFGGMKIKV